MSVPYYLDANTILGCPIANCVSPSSFAVSFSIPYLVFDDHAGLGSKVGFIFGSIALCALVFVYFCVPECKGKTLEQIDWLFSNGVGMRDFGKTDASGMLEEASRRQKGDLAETGQVERVESRKPAADVKVDQDKQPN